VCKQCYSTTSQNCYYTRSSAVAERPPRDASCLSVVSFNIPTAQVFYYQLLRAAASDLLVHKILLNSVLLSLIVSGGVRPPPGQTPLGHTPLFAAVRGSVGVRTPPRGSDRVRSQVSVSFLQKYPPGSVLRCPTAAENGGYDLGGCVWGGFDLLSGV